MLPMERIDFAIKWFFLGKLEEILIQRWYGGVPEAEHNIWHRHAIISTTIRAEAVCAVVLC